jgi:bacterioferritin-associated ferredoxin
MADVRRKYKESAQNDLLCKSCGELKSVFNVGSFCSNCEREMAK